MCQVRGALSLEGQKLLSGLHRGRELPAEQSDRPGSAVSGCRCRAVHRDTSPSSPRQGRDEGHTPQLAFPCSTERSWVGGTQVHLCVQARGL